MRGRLTAGLCWIVAGFAAPAAGAAVAPDTLRARAAAIDTYVARLGALGWSGVLVVDAAGKPLVERACGKADRERGTPWSTGTVSDIGSITKQFTATAILRLQEQGRLRVGDPLAKHITGVPADKSKITLHHLLTHTSGVVDLPDKDDWDPVGRDDIVRLTMAAPLASEPGARYEYSNAGYSLLGVVLETLTGESYETYLRRTFFTPHGMHDTGYILPRWEASRLAIGYEDGKRWGTTVERPFASDGPYWILRANGGIHTTANDMRGWAAALLEDRVLEPESRRALWTKHVDESNGNRDSYYGYGWSIDDLPDGRIVANHGGSNGVFYAHLAIEPAEKLVVFLLTNIAAEFPSREIAADIGRHLASGVPLPEVPEVRPMDAGIASRIAGTYRVQQSDRSPGDGGSFEVRVAGNALAVESSSWRNFARLYGAPEVAIDRLESQSRTVEAFVQASLHRDLAPMHTAYDGRVPIETLKSRSEMRLQGDAERYGPLRNVRTAGTLPTAEGSMTFVRFEHEGGTHHRRYVWNNEGKLRGLMAGRREGPPPFYWTQKGPFASFEVGFVSARIYFVDGKGGDLLEFGPERQFSAVGRQTGVPHVPEKK